MSSSEFGQVRTQTDNTDFRDKFILSLPPDQESLQYDTET
jgi:hypothetical protein